MATNNNDMAKAIMRDGRRNTRSKEVLLKLLDMKMGDIVEFPIDWMRQVRYQCYYLNVVQEGVRSTFINKTTRKIYVEYRRVKMQDYGTDQGKPATV